MTVPAPTAPRRLVFLGTPSAAVPSLLGLVDAGFDVALVVSRPDRRRGRGSEVSPSPVKAAALDRGIPVSDQVDDALTVDADLGVVVAFGRILRPPLLDRLPLVNVHFSLLPRWRGAAPVERAVLAGDERTGVCVMEVVEALDAGGVHGRAEIAVDPRATADELRDELSKLGARLLIDTILAGLGRPEPQEGEITYAEKITPEDLRINWSEPAASALAQIRVGGAWTTLDGRRLRILTAEPAPAPDQPGGPGPAGPGPAPGEIAMVAGTVLVGVGEGVVALGDVQAEGRGRQPARTWANGARLPAGQRLGS